MVTANLHWHQVPRQPKSTETLPVAVAILVPAQLSAIEKNQLAATLESVSFAESVWLGESAEPITDFAAARNSVLPLLETPWVLWLDSDEWFDPVTPVIAELKKIFALANVSGVYCQRQDWFLGQPLEHGETAHVKLLRLMKVTAGHFHRPVHEVFTVADGGFVTDSTILIQHKSHSSLNEFLTTVSQYAQLEANFRHQTKNPSRSQLMREFLIFPPLKFCLNFGWNGGWRDGWRGFTYALMMSIHSAAVRIYGWEYLAKNQKNANHYESQ